MPSWSAVLVLFAMLSMGFLGFIDDFAKVRKKQSEGLTVKGKFIGQFILATIYAVLALILPTKSGFPSAQAGMSFIEKPFFSFEFAGRVVAIVLFVIWVNFLMTAWTNAINLTDGLDGLAARLLDDRLHRLCDHRVLGVLPPQGFGPSRLHLCGVRSS